MVSNTKRKRNIAGVPCTPTPRVPFLLAFSLFAFEVAAVASLVFGIWGSGIG